MKLVRRGSLDRLASPVSLAGAASLAAQQARRARSPTSTPRRSSSRRPATPRPSPRSPRSSRPIGSRCRSSRPALDSAASDFEQQSVMLSPTQRAAKRKDLAGAAAEAGAAHPGAAAAGRHPGAGAARPDPEQGQQRHRGHSGRGQLRHDLRRERAQQRHRHGRQVAGSHHKRHPAAQSRAAELVTSAGPHRAGGRRSGRWPPAWRWGRA